MSKFFIYFIAMFAVAFVFSSPYAFSGEGKMMGKEMTVTGRVVDPACYIAAGLKGADHKGCAILCAKAGQAFGILDEENDVLYQVIEGSPGADPNKLLMDHVEEVITVKGMVFEKSNMKAIVPKEIL